MLKKFKDKYESIDYIYSYIDKNYKGAVLLGEKSLELDNFIQKDFSKNTKNCSIISITRLIKYYSKKISKLSTSEQEIFGQVYNIALAYNFSEIYGTNPTKIDDILRDYFSFFGIKTKAKGHYLGNFYKPVKSEIDKGRPLIMNIAFGKYHNHTVTVTGYKIFKYRNMNIKFIELYDGWTREKSYLDYNAFSHSLFSFGLCSYNTLEIL